LCNLLRRINLLDIGGVFLSVHICLFLLFVSVFMTNKRVH